MHQDPQETDVDVSVHDRLIVGMRARPGREFSAHTETDRMCVCLQRPDPRYPESFCWESSHNGFGGRAYVDEATLRKYLGFHPELAAAALDNDQDE
ncbi:Hypothetical protein UVM_LOCUS154 [uncultured virus]|nr:Hypothetical protein UVM_LOCUS154 [uncultured virus]